LRILFDHNVNRRFRKHLAGHIVETAREKAWEKLANGVLLQAAADAGFDLLVTTDKNLEHQQNLGALPIPIVLIDSSTNALSGLLPFAAHILNLLNTPLDKLLYVIRSDGTVIRLTSPRP
jgi:predicted nuclease of predicted toxin-antitoxin system